ncbi:MAG: hypothetical protein NXI32_03640 [bacterium]|nr:hypothetical protein [bacterium]
MKPDVFDPNCPEQPLLKACHQLGWLYSNALAAGQAAGPTFGHSWDGLEPAPRSSTCWLQWLVAVPELKPNVKRALREQLAAGFRLATCDLPMHGEAVQPWSGRSLEWIGPRYCFGHHSCLNPTRGISAIVSSRLGRRHAHLPEWPTVLESILRDITRTRSQLLLTPGSTLADAIRDFAAIAEIPTVSLQLPKANESLPAWMKKVLMQPVSKQTQPMILLSPVALENRSEEKRDPIQDRAAIYLAERLYCLLVRQRGTIERLLDKRLSEGLHATGSIFLRLSEDSSPADREWLNRGVVGWYVPRITPDAPWIPLQHFIHTECGRATTHTSRPRLRQLTSAIPRAWSTDDIQDWSWLTHCTRSSSGAGPDESEAVQRLRLWQAGREIEQHPLSSLERICRDGRILGSRRLMRSKLRCVSFSAVPLPQLLERRTYRSHLARWDWEPFGLLISRRALQALGAKPVIYGSEADFRQLSADQRPFYQPRGTKQDWTQELEWRVVGDVDLSALPRDSIRLFTETREQAQRLAERYAWPVFWTEQKPKD